MMVEGGPTISSRMKKGRKDFKKSWQNKIKIIKIPLKLSMSELVC